MSMFPTVEPPRPEGVDLVLGDVSALLAAHRGAGARLVIADPPWDEYQNRPGVAAPDLSYGLLSAEQIAAHVDAAYDCALPGARLALWACWPLLIGWLGAPHPLFATRWKWVSGGSWHKAGSQGVGYHWLGRSEPLLLAVKPGGTPTVAVDKHGTRVDCGNAWSSPRTDHSEKPVGWYREMLRRWTKPGDLVLSVYSGLFPEGRACALEGRRCIGAEIDPERHAAAVGRLAQWRTAR